MSKKEFFINGITGEMGTFLGYQSIAGEEGIVRVTYIPLANNPIQGLINVFKKKTISNIPEKAIVRVPTFRSGSIEQETTVVVTENSEGKKDWLDKIIKEKTESLNELREAYDSEKWKAKVSSIKQKESQDSIDRQKKKERERSGHGGSSVFNPSGRGEFMPRYDDPYSNF